MVPIRRSIASVLLVQVLLVAACAEDNEPRVSIEEFKLEPSEVGIGETTRITYRVDRHAGIELISETGLYQGPADQLSEETAIADLLWEDEGTLLCTFKNVADWYNGEQTVTKVLLCLLDGESDEDGEAIVYRSPPLIGDSVELTLASCILGAKGEGMTKKEDFHVVCDTETVVLHLSDNAPMTAELSPRAK